MMTLQPMAMVRPSRDGVYAPSRLRPVKHVADAEFVERYADTACAIQVSVGGVTRAVTGYGYGLDCWYILARNRVADG